jgi:PAS domain S-box-containing protein
MSIFTLLSLSSAVLIFTLGNFIYYQDRKSSLNRVYFLLCVAIAGWAFCEFMYRQAGSPDIAYLWIKANQFAYFVPPILLNFTLIFTEKTKWLKSKLTYILIYAPALILVIIDFFTHQITITPVKEFWGYTYGVPNSLFYNLFHIWGLGIGVLVVYLIWRYLLTTTNKTKKKQIKYFLLGSIIPIIAGITEALLSELKFRVPELTIISMNWLVIFISYAIWKYKLFVLDPTTASENIVSTMSDSLILLDPAGKIVTVNQATLNLFGYSKEKLVDNQIEILLAEKTLGNKLLQKIIDKKSLKDYELTFKDKEDKDIIVSLSGSLLKDKTGKIAGFVLVSHDITEHKKAEEEIKKNAQESERMNKFMVGREMKIKELKKENEELKEKISQVFKEKNPEVVFTFDIEKEGLVYHHRDHETVGKISLEVTQNIKPAHIYFYHTSAPNTLVNITEVINKKIEAMNAHKSQSHSFLG